MNEYILTFETLGGEIVQECIFADTLREAKEVVRDNYSVKIFL